MKGIGALRSALHFLVILSLLVLTRAHKTVEFKSDLSNFDDLVSKIRSHCQHIGGDVKVSIAKSAFRQSEDSRYPFILEGIQGCSSVTWNGGHFSAGHKVTSTWTKMSNGVWVTNYTSPNGWYPKSLWANGERMIRARSSILRFKRPLNGSLSNLGFVYERKDFIPIMKTSDRKHINIIVYFAWTTSRQYIRDIFPDNNTVTFTSNSFFPISVWAKNAGAKRYYIENLLQYLDEENEWYYDENKHLLYLYPPLGSDPNGMQVILPTGGSIFQVTNSTNQIFNGTVFENSDFICTPTMVCDFQAAPYTVPAVLLANSSDILFDQCIIRRTGGYGWQAGGNCNNITFTRGLIYDTEAGGARIGTDSIGSATEYVSVTNSYLFDGGRVTRSIYSSLLGMASIKWNLSEGVRVTPAGCGVLLQYASYCNISNNEIHDYYYTGVSVGWAWAYENGALSTHNLVSYNKIYNIGTASELNGLSDMGGIYTLGISNGTRLIGNVIHNIQSFNYGAWGIYLDQASSAILVVDNLVYDTKSALFHQHFGMDNVIVNNIWAFGGEGQPDGGVRTDPDLPQPNSLTFFRNIVYFDQGMLFYGIWNFTNPPYIYRFDHNLWFVSNRSNPLSFPGNLAFTEWQEEVDQDLHSLVADPLFVNASLRNFDFQPGSPFSRIGFKPFDISLAGPTWTYDPDII